MMKNELLQNLDKLHTTPMGVDRIRRNLALGDDVADVVAWCRAKIESPAASIERRGKNWYAAIDGCVITVNAYSWTIITAHKKIKARYTKSARRKKCQDPKQKTNC